MSQPRDAFSWVWPGELCWARFLVQGDPETHQARSSPDRPEITIHARTPCVRTWRLKRLLRRRGYAFEVVVDLTGDGDSGTWPDGTVGRDAAPRVFVGGRLVGGLEELRMLERSGNLDRLLRGAV